MRQFISVAFGGIFAVAIGISIAYGSSQLWLLLPAAHDIVVVDPIEANSSDAASISSGVDIVRFTASEEEQSSSAADSGLPTTGSNKITALAYIVRDLSDSRVAALSHNSDRLVPVASLTKLITAEVVRNLIPDDARITISQKIMATYGNTADFRVGETFTAKDLMYPLLMVSSNDAAEAYAQYYGRAKFVAAMDDFTRSIGAYRTYFADPSGLSPQNVSTAEDMAIILDWLYKNDPDILAITQLKSWTVRDHVWVNPTHFLSWSNYAGGKNGYIPEANRTGASLFRAGPKNDLYAVVVLGSSSRDSDELNLLAAAAPK